MKRQCTFIRTLCSRYPTVKKEPPFRIDEKGWGEFEMMITLTPLGGGKNSDHVLHHDLNFNNNNYNADHKVSFKNPKPELMERLKASGPVPGEGANGVRGAGGAGSAKKRKANNVDMDKLAEGLQQLGEDDLLHVVQMVHEQKTADTYTKNDVESKLRLAIVD